MNMHRFVATLVAMALLSVAAVAHPPRAWSQEQRQMKDEVAQLAGDLKVGMDRSTLTEQQKAQLRDDFKELQRAHKNHETFATMRAARSIRTVLDSGAFKPEDRQKIKQDMQTIKQARESRPGLGG
jgi:Spy/CpxP family protein refolding chaperone